MQQAQDIPLTIESFPGGDDSPFRIPSKREMLSILQRLVAQGTRVALYFDQYDNFVLTTLLSASEDGIWVDVGPHAPENESVLLSRRITFVSMHQNVKVQFVSTHVGKAKLGNRAAFHMELPQYLLRIQRRESFRQAIPPNAPIKCIIPIRPNNSENPDLPAVMREVPVLDISVGGIGLLCNENEAALLKGSTFADCEILLPDIGTAKVTIEVRSNIPFIARNGATSLRAGCQFIDLRAATESLLYRYTNRLQAEALSRE